MSSETNSGQLPNEIENVESMSSDKRMLGRKQLTAAETLSIEIQEKVKEAFQIFDHENNNTVDAREIGIYIIKNLRSLLHYSRQLPKLETQLLKTQSITNCHLSSDPWINER